MKNKLIFGTTFLFLMAFAVQTNAQLKVFDNGNVGVKPGANVTPLSPLTIGGTGQSNAKVYVLSSGSGGGDQYGLYSKITWGNLGTKYAIYGYNVGTGGTLVGVKGEAVVGNATPTYGVYGTAGGGTNGKNYGVFGLLKTGDIYGAGVYGTNDGTSQQLTSRYAGYFRGLTYVNGDFGYLNLLGSSDARLKTNIRDINSGALQKIRDLRPVQFQWQQVEDVVQEDSVMVKVPHFSEDVDFDRSHYGFVAQELQKLFPELVQEDGSGYLSVSYIELIPLLVQAVQSLSTEVEDLNKQLMELNTSK